MTVELLKMIDQTGFFTTWTDPYSGVVSRVLTHMPAPLVQSFYFTNQTFTDDGRYLWFYAAYPPAGNANYGRVLGVIDFVEPDIRLFPETAFLDGSPLVDLQTGDAYWATGLEAWRRGPGRSDCAVPVAVFPAELAKNRNPYRFATHFTFSADWKCLNFDMQIGNEWLAGDVSLDEGRVSVWKTFEQCFNHAQFSPTDPDAMLIAQDWWYDANTGEAGLCDNRMWLLRRDGTLKLLLADGSADQTHEWWDADGCHVWFVDYKKGTGLVNIDTGLREDVWGSGTCHSHASRTGRYLVGDIGPYDWENGCRVTFYNRYTRRELNIVSDLPKPDLLVKYHIDPHPQFCLHDSMIAYTTTVNGNVTLALVDTEQLITKTAL